MGEEATSQYKVYTTSQNLTFHCEEWMLTQWSEHTPLWIILSYAKLRNIPLNSFLRKTLKSSRPRRSFSSSKKLKDQRSTRILVGTSTLEPYPYIFVNRKFTQNYFHLFKDMTDVTTPAQTPVIAKATPYSSRCNCIINTEFSIVTQPSLLLWIRGNARILQDRQSTNSPSHIKSPVWVIVCLPRVAGWTGGQEWVVVFVGCDVLDQSVVPEVL